MGIGIVGKPAGVRLLTGSVNYGKDNYKERYNLVHRLHPNMLADRSIIILGRTIKQEIVVIPATVAQAVVAKVRKPRTKKTEAVV